MAQLVAHHTGSVGVTGSSPVSSTIYPLLAPPLSRGFYYFWGLTWGYGTLAEPVE